jgi:hypothetical protein
LIVYIDQEKISWLDDQYKKRRLKPRGRRRTKFKQFGLKLISYFFKTRIFTQKTRILTLKKQISIEEKPFWSYENRIKSTMSQVILIYEADEEQVELLIRIKTNQK